MIQIDNFKKMINECLQDSDCLIKYSEELCNSYTEALEAIDNAKDETEKLKEKNNELRDECRKWINRAGIIQTTTTEEKEETYEDISKKLKMKMKGK